MNIGIEIIRQKIKCCKLYYNMDLKNIVFKFVEKLENTLVEKMTEADNTYVIQDPEYYDIMEEEIEKELTENETCTLFVNQVTREFVLTVEAANAIGVKTMTLRSLNNEESFTGETHRGDKLSKVRKVKISRRDRKKKSLNKNHPFVRAAKIYRGLNISDIEPVGRKEGLSDCNSSSSSDVGETHSRSMKRKYSCTVCGRSYDKKYSLERHRMTHLGKFQSQKFTCDICGKQTMYKKDLLEHMRVHTGEKPFKCDVCGMTFTQKSNLLRHNRVHTGEPALNKGKVIQCDICGRTFGQPQHLPRHMKCHFPSSKKEYKCEVCSREFSEKHHLKRHSRLHTGEKPYKCEFCGKTFAMNESCSIHKRIHTMEKPHECSLCGKAFSQVVTLNNHMYVHSGDTRSYKCGTCGEKFTKSTSYKNHLKEHKTMNRISF